MTASNIQSDAIRQSGAEASVLLHTDGPVATVWLNRPETRNAFDEEMIARLNDIIQQASGLPGVRVIVLRGKGKAFCAGADLAYMSRAAAYQKDQNFQDSLRLSALFQTVALSPLPVVAVVHGFVMGGANGLVAAADVAIAAWDTVFGFTEVKLGIVPAVISPFVVRKVMPSKAREWMLSGRKFVATEALQSGLVQHLAEPGLEQTVLDAVIEEFLTASPQAISRCKELLEEVQSGIHSYNDLQKITATYIADARASAEGIEGMQAFLGKRKPSWCPTSAK
jgi:methylglutaconyl-CoA hydratase